MYFSLEESHNQLIIDATSEVEVNATPVDDLSDSPPWEESAPDAFRRGGFREPLLAREFSFDSPYVTHSSDLESLRASFVVSWSARFWNVRSI